jgi:hypothetical protein
VLSWLGWPHSKDHTCGNWCSSTARQGRRPKSNLSVNLSVSQSVSLSVCLSGGLAVWLSVWPSRGLAVWLSGHLDAAHEHPHRLNGAPSALSELRTDRPPVATCTIESHNAAGRRRQEIPGARGGHPWGLQRVFRRGGVHGWAVIDQDQVPGPDSLVDPRASNACTPPPPTPSCRVASCPTGQ